MASPIAEYMKGVRAENRRLLDQLRTACQRVDPEPTEAYHNTQAGTIRWALALIEKTVGDQFKPIQRPILGGLDQ